MAGNVTYLRQKLKVDAVNAFYECLKDYKKTIVAFEQLAMMPAPQFYVEFNLARRMVSLIERGKPLPIENENKLAMYKELHRRWKSKGVASYESLQDIINEPAPCFYRSPESLKLIVYRQLKSERKR